VQHATGAPGERGSLALAAGEPFFIAGDVVVDLQTGDGTMSVKVSLLEVRRIRTTPVQVPMTYALGTSRARTTSAPLLLIHLETEEGIIW